MRHSGLNATSLNWAPPGISRAHRKFADTLTRACSLNEIQMTITNTLVLLLLESIVMGALSAPIGGEVGQSVQKSAWSVLETGLHDEHTNKRIQALAALGLMEGDKKAIQIAERALHEPNPDMRRAAVTALGDMDSKRSAPLLKALIPTTDPKTIITIAAALNKLKDPEADEIYYEVLTGKRKDGNTITDGIKDRKAIEKMGVETAIGFLPFGGVGTGAYNYFKDNASSHSNVYVTAANALAEDRDPLAEKALVQTAVGAKEPVQIAALRALARRGDPTVIDDIYPVMQSNKTEVSYIAAATILHLSDLRSSKPSRGGRADILEHQLP